MVDPKDVAEQKDSAGDVNLYVRLPGEVVRQLNVVAAQKGLKRPAAITEAVQQWLDRASGSIRQPVGNSSEGKPQNSKNVGYNTSHIVRAAHKGRETLTTLAQIMAEIEEAAGQGEDEAGAESGRDEHKQSLRSAAAQIEDRLGAFAGSASELQGRNEAARVAKQRRNRKVPGGRS